MLLPQNLGFWQSILTSFEKMVGRVCYIFVSSLDCLFSLLFHVVCHEYVQLLLTILFLPLAGQESLARHSALGQEPVCISRTEAGAWIYCLRAQHKEMTRNQRPEPDVLRKKLTETSKLFLTTCSWCSLRWLLFCFLVFFAEYLKYMIFINQFDLNLMQSILLLAVP